MEFLAGFVHFLLLLMVRECLARSLFSQSLPSKVDDSHRRPLQLSRPYNIAHRGSNGEFPEETAAAYMVVLIIFSLFSLLYGI